MWAFYYVISTVLVFLFSYRLGHQQSLSEVKPCPVKAVTVQYVHAEEAEIAQDLSSLPLCPENEPRVYDHCLESPYTSETLFLHLARGTVPEDVFPSLHHPGSPAKWSFVMTQSMTWPHEKQIETECKEVYLTRAGSRPSQPNKCTAVVKVPEGMASAVHSSHRIGYTARLTGKRQHLLLSLQLFYVGTVST